MSQIISNAQAEGPSLQADDQLIRILIVSFVPRIFGMLLRHAMDTDGIVLSHVPLTEPPGEINHGAAAV